MPPRLLKTWADHNDCQLARILTVDALRLSCPSTAPKRKRGSMPVSTFSDVVLLNRREGVNNKWVKDFEDGYRKQFSHCPLPNGNKKGRVANPLEVLEP